MAKELNSPGVRRLEEMPAIGEWPAPSPAIGVVPEGRTWPAVLAGDEEWC